jgi:hypothetical protein
MQREQMRWRPSNSSNEHLQVDCSAKAEEIIKSTGRVYIQDYAVFCMPKAVRSSSASMSIPYAQLKRWAFRLLVWNLEDNIAERSVPAAIDAEPNSDNNWPESR